MMQIACDITDCVDFVQKYRPFHGIPRTVRSLAKNLETQLGSNFVPFQVSRYGQLCPSSLDRLTPEPTKYRKVKIAKNWLRTRLLGARDYRISSQPLEMISNPEGWIIFLGSSWHHGTFSKSVSWLKQQNNKARLAVLLHDLLPIDSPKQSTNPAVIPKFERWLSDVKDHADVIFTNSRSTQERLLFHIPSIKNRLYPLQLGIDPLSKMGTLSRFPQIEPHHYIVFVSSLRPRKQHAFAVAAWIDAFNKDPKQAPQLVFVGYDSKFMSHSLMKQAKDAGMKDRLIIINDTSDEEMAALVRESLFFIYPSLYEGWGLPISEALSLGKTGLASDCTSLPEAGGDFIDYVKPNDKAEWTRALLKMTQDEDRRNHMEERIRKDYRPFSWEKSADMLEKTLRNAPYNLIKKDAA